MFAFAFDQTLFEFAAARPQSAPLFELPPNSHSLITFSPTIEIWIFFEVCVKDFTVNTHLWIKEIN